MSLRLFNKLQISETSLVLLEGEPTASLQVAEMLWADGEISSVQTWQSHS